MAPICFLVPEFANKHNITKTNKQSKRKQKLPNKPAKYATDAKLCDPRFIIPLYLPLTCLYFANVVNADSVN